MAIWSAEIKELERLYESFKGQLPELEKELIQLLVTRDANVALLYSRRSLEIIITDVCERELKRPRGTEPLKGIIDKLHREKKVPSHIIASMTGLNDLSTFGTHPKEFDPRQVKPVLNNLSTILEWYLKYKNFGLIEAAQEKEDEQPINVTDKDHFEAERYSEPEKSPYKRYLRVSMKKFGSIIPWLLTGILAGLLATILVIWLKSINETKPVYSNIYYLPEGEIIGNENFGSSVSISPDGTTLVYVSRKDDKSFLSKRLLSEFYAQQIPGTEGAESPFFSPDSKWVAFFADGSLKKISLLGGTPQTICEARSGQGGCWGEDDAIIFADWNNGCLMEVLATGGAPKQLTTGLNFSAGDIDQWHRWPHVLPGGKTILFTIYHNPDDKRIVAYSLETGERWNVIDHGTNARYVKTGHIVFAWKGDLLAVPFNPDKIEVTGHPEVILKGVVMNNQGLAHFSISNSGSLVYIPGNLIDRKPLLTLVSRDGNTESLNVEADQDPRFSRDGKQILYALTRERTQLWIYGLERGTNRMFTEREFESYWGIWTPDDSEIVFQSNMHGPALTMYQQMADGSGPVKRIISGKYHQQPKCWANDGTILIYTEGFNPETGIDIFSVEPGVDTIPKPLLNSRFNEIHPSLSPGERWLAYVSDESGREEVWVCSFPDLSNRIQISPDGGVEPLWSPDGKELYYRDISGDKLMVVSISDTNGLQAGIPEILISGKYRGWVGLWGRNYDISPDGSKFLMIEEEEIESTATQINIILNWSQTLKD